MAPDVDALEEDFGEFGVKFVTSLSDAGQPYSAEQWQSNFGDSEVPLVIDENSSSTGMFGLFHDSWNAFPTFAILDHTMTVRAKPWTLSSNSNTNACDGSNTTISGWSGGNTANFLQQLVDECGPLCEECSGTIDSDGDGIADECDDCNNMAGDLNDDMTIDILDIVTTVNIVLTGGINSTDFTDCEKTDADMTGDGTINILDVIQIINAVLGNNLSLSFDSSVKSEYVEIEATKKNGNLYLTVDSEYAAGLQINFNDFVSDVNLVDNKGYLTLDKIDGKIDRCVIYSLENREFGNDTFTIEVEGAAKLDCNKITAVAGDRFGSNMQVRFTAPEVRNFAINSLYPNPFNPITSIDYSVEKAGELRLSVYNILGQEVAVLYNGYQTEGKSFSVQWDAASFSSGVYFVNMAMNGQIETMKAVVVK